MRIIILVIILTLVFSLLGFYLAIRPFKITSAITPKDFGLTYENVTFQTKDNIILRGWFIPGKKRNAKTIILLHGYPADKGNILPAMLFLHDTYNLFLFDFRYFGESEGWYTTIGKNEVLDLLAAIQYLRQKQITEVGVWGFSLGGAVALMTAPKAPEIKAIVVQSGYARLDWLAYQHYPIPGLNFLLGEIMRLWTALFFQFDIKNVSPVDSLKQLKIPIMLIYSKQDQVVTIRHGKLLEEAFKNNPRGKIIFNEQGGHGEFFKNQTQIVEDFFKENLH